MAGIPTLPIDQGVTRIITVTHLVDAHGQWLNPTGWSIHAVARAGSVKGPSVAAWRDSPGTGEGKAEVVDADPTIDPTSSAGEKWIYLHVDPSMSDTWTWTSAELRIEIQEPGASGRQESFPAHLVLNPTTVF